MNIDNVDEDRRRAEVFDALSHPTRITILKALTAEPLGFADLKKKLGIESSGHLQHHINKLNGLIKTDDYGKYILSDQGKDALHSIDTVESVAKAKGNKKEKTYAHKKSVFLKSTIAVLVALLAFSSAIAAFEYSSASTLNKELTQLNSALADRDTLIIQLDKALHLAESRLNLKLPSESRYLTTLPDQDSEGDPTKIFMSSTAVGYHYFPAYPFSTPWFNSSGGSFSSIRSFELTKNRSIELSFWGWTLGLDVEMYQYQIGTYAQDPVLIIAVTIRNDYTSADLGETVANRTGSYVSSVNLALRLFRQNGSIIEAPTAENISTSPDKLIGGVPFLLETGQAKQIIFYLSPSTSDIEAIDHYEIYISSVSA